MKRRCELSHAGTAHEQQWAEVSRAMHRRTAGGGGHAMWVGLRQNKPNALELRVVVRGRGRGWRRHNAGCPLLLRTPGATGRARKDRAVATTGAAGRAALLLLLRRWLLLLLVRVAVLLLLLLHCGHVRLVHGNHVHLGGADGHGRHVPHDLSNVEGAPRLRQGPSGRAHWRQKQAEKTLAGRHSCGACAQA